MTGTRPCITSAARSPAASCWPIVGPNGAGKSTLLKGIVGELKPLSGSLSLDGLEQARHRLSAASHRDRPLLPHLGVRLRRHGAVAHDRRLARIARARQASRDRRACARSDLVELADRPVGSLSGGQFQRMLFARLLLQDAAVILLDEPFRAVDTKTVAELIALIERWHARGAPCSRRCTTSSRCARIFPTRCCWRARSWPGERRRQVLTPANLAKSRQLTEAFDSHAEICERDEELERESRMIDALVQPFIEFAFMRRALVGCLAISLTAPPIGVFLVLAAHEPHGRRHGPRHPAGRGHRLSARRAVAVRHESRWLRRRPRGGARRRSRRPLHRVARGCEPRRLLSGVAGARRDAGLGARQQCRSPACAVRHGAGARRRGAPAHRQHRHGVARGAGGDLPAARARMLRSGVPALGEPVELADPSRCSCCWWCSISSPASRRSAR